MSEIFYLYKISNSKNHKLYIGQTNDHYRRWSEHKSSARSIGPDITIDWAIKKHGIELFRFELIASCYSQHDANHLERLFILQYDSHVSDGNGYNVDWGGKENKMLSHETVEKMVEGIKKAYYAKSIEDRLAIVAKIRKTKSEWTEEYKNDVNQRTAATLTGVKHTAERRKNISISLYGKIPWNKGIKTNVIPWNKGLIFSPRYPASPKKPNSGRFTSKIDWTKINWPEDQELLSMINTYGLTATSDKLQIGIKAISKRLKEKGLKHNRKPGSPETTFQSGSKHKMAKLNEKQVLEIVKLSKTGLLQREIAVFFGVTRVAVNKILIGKNWSHITGIKPQHTEPKLNKKQLLEIIRLSKTNLTQKEIAAIYNISGPTISSILSGRTRSDITGIQFKSKPKKK